MRARGRSKKAWPKSRKRGQRASLLRIHKGAKVPFGAVFHAEQRVIASLARLDELNVRELPTDRIVIEAVITKRYRGFDTRHTGRNIRLKVPRGLGAR